MSFFHVLICLVFFSCFVGCAFAADGNGALPTAGTVQQLLGPLASVPTLNLSGLATLPWQYSFADVVTTSTFYFKSFLFSEIPGLRTQTRSALFQNVKDIRVRIRKVPGADISWRAFLCADADIDPADFSSTSLLEFVRSHPGAVPIHTLDKDTTQSQIDFDLVWLLGLGSSVAQVIPPLIPARIVIFAESSTSLTNKVVVATLHGTVEIGGFGYVGGAGGQVAPAPAATAGGA